MDMNLRIRDLREDADLTQKEVADHLHCDQSLYSKYGRGERMLPLALAIDLAKFSLVSRDYRGGLKRERKTGGGAWAPRRLCRKILYHRKFL